ncbi:MAG: RNA 2',3'-cyclic phosphodiesterase [Pseudomonadota bacterium]
MPRLFVALAVPEPIRTALDMARGGLPGARWIDPGDYHITLTFIGDVDDAVADRIADELSRVAAEPFDVTLPSYGAFAGDRKHSVHLQVERSEPLLRLHKACNAAVAAAGVQPEARKYAPHITVARLPKSAAASIAPWLDGRSYAGPRSFRAESFGLYTAAPSRGGGPYDEAVRYRLAG